MAKPSPDTFTVVSNQLLSPNMRRVQLTGTAIQNYPQDAEGGYIKLIFPKPGQDKQLLRTYTISNLDHSNNTNGCGFCYS